ncbi:MAG: thiamine phosphate synthase [Eubacteriales bacterium]|nr:thiamine phosphate synthase [Eubacteriales bacterium]
MDVLQVREYLGEDKIIGVSAQTVQQAVQAEKSGADYLGVGAVFSTSTKADADYVSRDTLREICSVVHIPVCAIGGIGRENLPKLSQTGIDGVALVSAIFAARDIRQECVILRELSMEMIKK